MARTEPDLPSIHTALADESAIATALARTAIDLEPHSSDVAPLATDPGLRSAREPLEPPIPVLASEAHASERAGGSGPDTSLGRQREGSSESEPGVYLPVGEVLDQERGRVWPGVRRRDLGTRELTNDRSEGARRYAWEP